MRWLVRLRRDETIDTDSIIDIRREENLATSDAPKTSIRDQLVESLKKNNHTQGMVGGIGFFVLIVLVSNLIGFDLSGFIAGLLAP